MMIFLDLLIQLDRFDLADDLPEPPVVGPLLQ